MMKVARIYIVGLLIASVIINGNVPLKAEAEDHVILLDPNFPSWNKDDP